MDTRKSMQRRTTPVKKEQDYRRKRSNKILKNTIQKIDKIYIIPTIAKEKTNKYHHSEKL